MNTPKNSYPSKKKLVLFSRQTRPIGNHSIENLDRFFLNNCKKDFDIAIVQANWPSNGIINRVKIIFQAFNTKCDFLHVTGDINFAGFLVPKRKLITTIHDTAQFFNHLRPLPRFLAILLWILIPILKSKYIVVVSYAMKNEIENFLGRSFDKIVVIQNPVLLEVRPEMERNDPSSNKLLHIGTKPNKNLQNTLKAISNLPVSLVVVGKIPQEEVDLAKRLNIKIENFVNIPGQQIVDLYSKSKALLFCSTYEGFGLPIIEAMSQNLPVITSDRGSMKEVAGDAAVLVDPEDSESIRHAVLRILNEPELTETLIAKGQKNIERFGQKKVAANYVTLVKKLTP